jgi:hypothetical protein
MNSSTSTINGYSNIPKKGPPITAPRPQFNRKQQHNLDIEYDTDATDAMNVNGVNIAGADLTSYFIGLSNEYGASFEDIVDSVEDEPIENREEQLKQEVVDLSTPEGLRKRLQLIAIHVKRKRSITSPIKADKIMDEFKRKVVQGVQKQEQLIKISFMEKLQKGIKIVDQVNDHDLSRTRAETHELSGKMEQSAHALRFINGQTLIYPRGKSFIVYPQPTDEEVWEHELVESERYYGSMSGLHIKAADLNETNSDDYFKDYYQVKSGVDTLNISDIIAESKKNAKSVN